MVAHAVGVAGSAAYDGPAGGWSKHPPPRWPSPRLGRRLRFSRGLAAQDAPDLGLRDAPAEPRAADADAPQLALAQPLADRVGRHLEPLGHLLDRECLLAHAAPPRPHCTTWES